LTKLFKSLAVYILVFVLIVLIAAIFVVVLLKNITEPLKKLVSVIKKFDSGNWEARVPSFNDDEIDMIGNAFNSMCENINNLVNVVYQKEILIRDAQMLALQSQINPHFLFNTLTTIATIAKKNKDEEVSGLIRNLSKLLRELAIIKDDGFSTLESELLTVDYYVSIQKVRFADRFEYILEKSDNVPENCRIPKLLIQPLVENAFCHGIETKIDGGYIKVRISCEDKYLVIEIIDNGVGFEKSKVFTEDEHTHITLSNIKKRLAVYYDEDFVFNINSRTDKGTNVYIRFPV